MKQTLIIVQHQPEKNSMYLLPGSNTWNPLYGIHHCAEFQESRQKNNILITQAPASAVSEVLDDAVGPHYIIAWASNLTSASGMGTTKFLHSEAVKIAEESNAKFPHISHCVLPDTKIVHGRVVPR